MKKKWQTPADISLLLGVLLIFSGSIGVINGIRTNKSTPALIKNFTVKQLYDYIAPLVISQSVEAVAEILKYVPFKTKLAITKKIISNDDGSLGRNDKLELLYAIVMHHLNENEKQTLLLNLLFEHKHLLKGEPFIYVAAKGLYAKVIPHLLAWQKLQLQKKVTEPAIRYMQQRALDAAVDANNLNALKKMVEHGVTVDKRIANDLLWEVIAKKDLPEFITYLKKLGADMNYSNDGKRTVLHFAIMQESPALIKKLLEEGADPNKELSKEVGAPLQQVLAQTAANNKSKKDNSTNVKIDLLLRDFGARQ